VKSIIAEDLVKTYDKGTVRALDHLSLDVEEGTVLGVLGPNGAGKTTTVRILATLLNPDSGRATVGGIDVGKKQAVARAEELLEQFSLTESARRPIKTYSGGMRRRLDLAASLIVKPKVLFLDEPTTGLDPRGRQEMWGVIQELVKGGVTLLLTTQYLEEADQLADEIAVIDHGKVIARGTSDALKKQVGGERLQIVVEQSHISQTMEIVSRVSKNPATLDEGMRLVSAPVSTGSAALIEALRELDGAGIHPLDVSLKRPSLDDVFMSLTGHVAEEIKEEVKK